MRSGRFFIVCAACALICRRKSGTGLSAGIVRESRAKETIGRRDQTCAGMYSGTQRRPHRPQTRGSGKG